MEKLYSLKEIRELLDSEGMGIPDGTLRNYRDNFKEFLKSKGKGRLERYSKTSIDVFKTIRRFRTEYKYDNDQIRKELAKIYEVDIDYREPLDVEEALRSLIAKSDSFEKQIKKLEELLDNIYYLTKLQYDMSTKVLSVTQQKIAQDQKDFHRIKTLLADNFSAGGE